MTGVKKKKRTKKQTYRPETAATEATMTQQEPQKTKSTNRRRFWKPGDDNQPANETQVAEPKKGGKTETGSGEKNFSK